MTRFSVPDLSQLAPAALIEALDYEAVLAELMADVTARFAAAGIDYDVGGLETDPAKIVMEVAAYRETLLRALVNDKARAVLLAYAGGSDLDHIGALFATARKVIVPAAGGAPAVMETDEEYRRRIQLAPEAFSVAGPAGAYAYFALAAHPSLVDAAVVSPSPGRVDVVVLARDGDGTPAEAAVTAVAAALSAKTTRPLTDDTRVRGPAILDAEVAVTIRIRPGPDPALIEARAVDRLAAHAAERRRVGLALRRDGLIAAARSVGAIEQVIVTLPAEDAEPGPYGVVHVTGISVAVEVVP